MTGQTANPNPDRAALRQRIAAALYEHEWPQQAGPWKDALAADRETYLSLADAVLAVMPPTADRAAILREAAHAIEEAQHRQDDAVNEHLGALDDRTFAEHVAVHRSGKLLRRMADETQPAEACPPGCVACATDESHDPAPADGARQDGAQP